MVDLQSLTDGVDKIFSKVGIEIKKKIKSDIQSDIDDIKNYKEKFDTIQDIKEFAENPAQVIRQGTADLSGFLIMGFIYFVVGATIIFSVYQVFKSNPSPLTDIKKGTKNVYSKSKKIVKNKSKNKKIVKNKDNKDNKKGGNTNGNKSK